MNSSVQEYTARVTHSEYISPKVIHVKAIPDREVDYVPGQYASLFVDQEIQRLYSFTSPSSDPHVEFIIDVEPNGPGSKYVKNVQIDDKIRFLAPFGHFTLDSSSNRPLLFIATGTGIAPLKAHIEYITETDPSRQITLIFGNKDEEHLIFHEEFSTLNINNSNFKYLPVCSTPSSAWGKDQGLVTDVLVDKIANPTTYDSYICGNSPMILSAMTTLRQKDVPDNQIHLESYT